MKKKGMGHLEAVLSVMIFLLAVMIILNLMLPNNKDSNEDVIFESIMHSLEKSNGYPVDFYTIIINNTNNQVGIKNLLSIRLDKNLTEEKKFIFNGFDAKIHEFDIIDPVNGEICISNVDGTTSVVKLISGEFDVSKETLTCPEVNESYYRIASYENKFVISEKALMKYLIDCTDYELKKGDLGIPHDMDYLISLDDRFICTKDLNYNTNVISKNFIVETINESGELNYLNLNVKIW